MSGVLTDLAVAGQLGLRHLGRKLSGKTEAAPDLDAFQARFSSLLSKANSEHIVQTHWLDLAGSTPPWLGTGLHLGRKEELSIFVEGRVYANKALDIWLAPALQLWYRLGDEAPVFRGSRSSHSFCAAKSAELQLGNYFPNDWQDLQGTRLHSDELYQSNSGSIRLLVIRWKGDAREGLQSLLAHGDIEQRIAGEIQRIDQPVEPPKGWHYLWNIGPGEIYQSGRTESGKACIHCHTHQDVGILQYPVDVEFDSSCELSWSWLLQQLPATLREDSVPSHDYLSIAVEFDNGRDISYYWSSSLEAETGFDCPLPNWAGKEYHVVVRSGTDGLKQWQQESRNLYQDYSHHMGEPPAKIVSIWLIANSVFMRGHGLVDYADIVLKHQGQESKVL